MSRLRSNRLGLGLEKRVRVRVRVSHNPNPNLDCHRRLISFRLGEILKLLFIKMDVEKTQSVFRRTDLKKKTAKKQIFQKTDKKRIKNGDKIFFFKFLKISKNVKTGKKTEKNGFPILF